MRAIPALVLTALLSGCAKEENEARDAGAPDGTVGEAKDVRTFAVSYFRLGFTTRDNENVTDAWKQYGFDLDSICTTTDDSQTSKGTCQRAMGSSGDVLTDGDKCIDNNFGAQLVTLIKAVDPQAEVKIGDGIKSGALTLVYRIHDVAESGADDNAPGELYAAKAASGMAALDGTDTFDVDTISVSGGDINQPLAKLTGKITIEDGHRVWTASADSLALPAVFISGASGSIPIRGARVSIDMDSGRGTIAGAAPIPDVQKVVGGVLAQQKLCPDNPFHGTILKSIERSADMPEQLPHDTGKTCTALSMGIGIEVVPATLGKVVPTGKPKPDPCAPDAGMDAATDSTTDAPMDSVATDSMADSAPDVADTSVDDTAIDAADAD